MSQTCYLIGVPMDAGKTRRGCLMGPDAYRTAGLAEVLRELGHEVTDHGNVAPDTNDIRQAEGIVRLPEVVGWTTALTRTAAELAGDGMPIFMGGDHALALGSVAGVAQAAKDQGKPLFVLWLDAHSDFHTPQTTASGNLHGTPVAYVTGQPGFDAFPPPPAPIALENVAMIGLRSVDAAERAALHDSGITAIDMRHIDEHGIRAPLADFLDRVAAADGVLHVSLDVDFLDPDFAPAVGTTVPGGATLREAHLAMEMLCDAGCVTSLDLVELNPFLDDRGKTARVMVDLVASLMGRRVFDRPTRSN